MKKFHYIILLIVMLIIDFILWYVSSTVIRPDYTILLAAIFAEVAIYSTLIIFEIKNNNDKNDDKK